MKDEPLPVDDLGLVTLDDKGSPPETRIKDVKSAHEFYALLRQADATSSRNRATIQAMFDGEPPYDQGELQASGQGDRVNLNFDEAAGQLEFAMGGYIDLLNAVETLVNIKLDSRVDISFRNQWEQILSEEVTNAIKSWPKFTYNFLLTCHHFISQGLCANMFPDPWNWQWEVVAFGDFLLPRRTRASEEEIKVVCAVRPYTADELYAFIRDEKIAESIGWNVPATRKAITDAASVKGSSGSTGGYDWERVQAELKNNDLVLGASSPEIRVVHLLAKEFDGKISHFMFREDGKNDDGFLFKKVGRFESAAQAFVMFTYGIGTNGYFHGIRGLGYKIQPHVQVSNRLRSQNVESAMLSSSLLIQPEDDEAMEEAALVYYGAFAVLPPRFKVVERAIPNIGTAVIPVLNDMNQMIQNKTGQYAVQNVFNSGRERSKFEVAAQLDSASKINATMLNLFYEPWERLLRESVRRMFRPDYKEQEPGGYCVKEMKERAIKRGVPEAVFGLVDWKATTANRAVGAGSEAARQMAYQEIMEFMPAFDSAGRQNLLRDRVASRVGYRMVDRYVPNTPANLRPPIDVKVAELENNQLLDGKQVPVEPNEPHVLHAEVHLNPLNQVLQAAEQQQLDDQQFMQMLPGLIDLHAHATEHVSAAAGDPTTAQEVAMMRQALQQVGEILDNGVKHMRKMQEQAAGEAAQQGGSGALPPDMQHKIIEHNAKLAMMSQESELRMNLDIKKAAKDLAIKEAAAAIALKKQAGL